MRQFLVSVALLATTAIAVAFYPLPESDSEPPPAQSQRPRVDVVFVLDTTGSMGGLIDTAKEKIWAIASTLAQGQPAPEIRIGLVGYRDFGDAYVTRVHDLNRDLDAMYLDLMAFQAAGGGDGPEAVTSALRDAVHRMSWAPGDHVYRAIFLVGDAPGHEGRLREPDLQRVLEQAKGRGIVVNTILCGTDARAAQQWSRIAQLAGGRLLSVDQNGGAIAMATPLDQRIAELARELDATRLFYGDAQVQRDASAKTRAATLVDQHASTAAKARRGIFNVSPGARESYLGTHELVDDVANGLVELDSLTEDDLPPELHALSVAERRQLIAEQAARRDAISAEIQQLAVQRKAHIRSELESRDDVHEKLEAQLFETVRDQAAPGIDYDDAEADY